MKSLSTALICAVILAVIILGVTIYFAARGQGAVHQLAHAEQQAGTATVAAGQAKAEVDATHIVVSGQARDHVDIEVHQQNAQAIEAAPGAGAAVDPDLMRRALVGMCRYRAAADDPQCVGLRQPGSAIVPPAAAGRAASPF